MKAHIFSRKSVVAKVHYCGEIKTLFCDGIELADTKAVTVMDEFLKLL